MEIHFLPGASLLQLFVYHYLHVRPRYILAVKSTSSLPLPNFLFILVEPTSQAKVTRRSSAIRAISYVTRKLWSLLKIFLTSSALWFSCSGSITPKYSSSTFDVATRSSRS